MKKVENIPMMKQAADDGRTGERAQLQDAQRHDRLVDPRLEDEEGDEQRDGRRRRSRGCGPRPSRRWPR